MQLSYHIYEDLRTRGSRADIAKKPLNWRVEMNLLRLHRNCRMRQYLDDSFCYESNRRFQGALTHYNELF